MSADRRAPMTAADEPVGTGAAGWLGIVLAVAVIALAVTLIREALVAAGLAAGSSWVTSAASAADGEPPSGWAFFAGLVAVLFGLVLLLGALVRRPRRTVAVRSRTGVFLGTRDVAWLAEQAATSVDGVTSAKADASRRRITIDIEHIGRDDRRDAVTRAVTAQLAALSDPPKVSVHAHGQTTRRGGDRMTSTTRET